MVEKILFGRTYGSVKFETGYPASPDPSDPNYTQAAEVISLLPDYFIGVPELPALSGSDLQDRQPLDQAGQLLDVSSRRLAKVAPGWACRK